MITPNRFAGICVRCGLPVAKEAGRIDMESFPGQRWPELSGTTYLPMVSHLLCHERYHDTNVHYILQPDAGASDASSE